MSIIFAIIIFGIIVIIHELGHFAMAKRGDICVEEFAIGMGPKLLSFAKGETLYSIRLFPIGGYCKMLGEEDGSSDPRAFNNKKVSVRLSVIAAGVIMNFILSLLVFTILGGITGFALPKVNRLLSGFPAEQAGIQLGDRILEINGSRINIYDDLSLLLSENKGNEISVSLLRGKERIQKRIVPKQDEKGNFLIGFEPVHRIGLFMKSEEGYQKANILETLNHGFFKILFWIKVIVQGLIRLVTFNVSVNEMAGPVGIVSVIDSTVKATSADGIFIVILNMANFLGLLSANLGVFNLLPLPGLDGGRLVFLGIEAIRRKPIPAEKEGFIHLVGFVVLIAFAIFITFNDIMRLI